MRSLSKIVTIEAKLLLREPGAWVSAVLLPIFILVVLGMIPMMRTPDPVFDGLRFIDLFVPSLVVMTLAIIGVNTLPVRLASYREKGVLRRLATTPVNPAFLLVAQLVINVGMAVGSVLLLIVVGWLAFQIPLPQDPGGFALAFGLGMTSLFALGLLIAALAPSSRVATAATVPVFILVMLVGGVYVPRIFLPEFLVRIGDFTPPGVQAILDAWQGIAPNPLPLAAMAAVTVAAGMVAARWFRWE